MEAQYALARQHYEHRRWAEAIAVYQRITSVAPHEVDAWALMGLCATQQGDLALATQSLSRAAQLSPTAANIHFRLGIVLYQQGQADQAVEAFRRAVDLDPSNHAAQQNLGAALVDVGRHAEAQPIFENLLQRDPNLELAWAGLANVHRALNNREGLIVALQRAVSINPANPATQHLLIAARGETPARPDPRYVESFFDNYAQRFDHHLTTRLGYQAPEQLCALLQQTWPESRTWGHVLDLGCGTGLFAQAIHDRFGAHTITGVDLSRKMLDAAQARGLYGALVKADVVDYVQNTTDMFGLIAATDVFIYVGELTDLFAGAARCLHAGGAFVFSLEETTEPGFVLTDSGRYAHSRSYVEELAIANAFEIAAMTTAPLRRDGQAFDDGLLVVLKRSAARA